MFEPAEERRDREVTMGPGLLAVLALGLVTLCGVCFVFGYAVGHRSSQPAAVTPVASAPPASALTASNQPKPSATQDGFQPAAAPAMSPDASPAASPDASTAANPVAPPANPQASTAGGTPATPAGEAPAVVQTALPAAQAAGQPIAANGVVHPALAPGSRWMVQIAAVSQAEDADVLLSALRQRGYAVAVRHDPVDNLLHVQVGPFASHDAAMAMRQRLLNDGYNAIVQP